MVQKADFEEILEAMDGLPVTVRLLDPPLHEFLPRIEELAVKEATVGLTDEEQRAAATRPRRGTSSTRCSAPAACASAWSSPGLYAMQVRALHGGGRRAGRRRAASRSSRS